MSSGLFTVNNAVPIFEREAVRNRVHAAASHRISPKGAKSHTIERDIE